MLGRAVLPDVLSDCCRPFVSLHPHGGVLRLSGPVGVCLVVTPKVTLLSDPTQEDPERRVLLVCLVEGLPSAGAAIQWLQDNEEMTPAPESDESGCSDCTESGVTQWSRVNVTRKSWEGGARFGCRVTHEGLKEPLSATVRNECGGEDGGGGGGVIRLLNLTFSQF